ncbi:hypothetical protein EI94DRAFT_1282917 [Lactarius quietus]|nr:hypothetical protein EI94DRAFT_1282917 [Lactarius quietus]
MIVPTRHGVHSPENSWKESGGRNINSPTTCWRSFAGGRAGGEAKSTRNRPFLALNICFTFRPKRHQLPSNMDERAAARQLLLAPSTRTRYRGLVVRSKKDICSPDRALLANPTVISAQPFQILLRGSSPLALR